MRVLERTAAESQAVAGVEVTRWEQYQLPGLPFQAMWYQVPAGGTAPLDRHPEPELSVVVSGVAEVHAGGGIEVIAPGGAFLLDSDEPHMVRNRSADKPLLVFSAYWMPEQLAGGAGEPPDA